MKNKIRSMASAISVVSLTFPAIALAQFQAPGGTNLPEGTIMGIVSNFMNWLLIIVGILGVIGFAIAGIMYLVSAGNEDTMNAAKRAMIYSIIGVIVALLGLIIIKAAQNFLQGNTTSF